LNKQIFDASLFFHPKEIFRANGKVWTDRQSALIDRAASRGLSGRGYHRRALYHLGS
jgi:hypothetical protein